MKNIKKLICLALAFSTIFQTMPPVFAQEELEEKEIVDEFEDAELEEREIVQEFIEEEIIVENLAEGNINGQTTWMVTEDGKLFIYGNGAMDNYSINSVVPWQSYLNKIKSVWVEEGVTSIGDYAFKNCSQLQDVHIKGSVSKIGSHVFYGCSNISIIRVDMYNTVYNSDEDCQAIVESSTNKIVYGCKNTVILDGISAIGDYAFEGCMGLASLILPDSVTSIGQGSFLNCSGLQEVTIPKSVGKIEPNSFDGCANLNTIRLYMNSYADSYFNDSYTKVYFDEKGTCGTNLTWSFSQDGLLTISGSGKMSTYDDEDIPWASFKNRITRIVIEEGVTSLSNRAFYACSNVKSVTLPKSLTTLGRAVFQDCTSLASIEIPSSITSLSWGLFYGCTSLKEVLLPSTLKTIGDYVFADNTSLASISIGRNVTSIGNSAFKGCTSLKTLRLSKNSVADQYFDNSYTKEYVIENESLEGYSLSLQGNIGIHFYMHIDDSILANSNIQMNFTLPNGKTSVQTLQEATKSVINGKTYYVFTCFVSAKEMTQDIKAQLSDSYGNVGNVYSYTVEEYANYLMDHANSYSSKEVAIAKAMMTYGYYAQEYFDYQTNRLPSRINELENVNLDSYAYRLIDNNDALNFVGARLVLTSKPGLKLYFKGDVSFKGYTTTKEEGLSVITVSDIENMEQIYTFSMDDFLLKYGIFSYGKKAMETDNEALIHLIQAMYAYQKALQAYVNF